MSGSFWCGSNSPSLKGQEVQKNHAQVLYVAWRVSRDTTDAFADSSHTVVTRAIVLKNELKRRATRRAAEGENAASSSWAEAPAPAPAVAAVGPAEGLGPGAPGSPAQTVEARSAFSL